MKRKTKTLVIFFAGLIISFIIFIFTYNNKMDYLVLGDDLSLGRTPFNDYNKSYSDFIRIYLKNKRKLESYNISFTGSDRHITDVIDDIKSSKEINKININQSILKADIITISLGQKELENIIKSNYKNGKLRNIESIYTQIDTLFEDYKTLLNLIKKINDPNIYIVGYYNPLINSNQQSTDSLSNIVKYIDIKFEKLTTSKKVHYIKISDTFDKKNYYIPSSKNAYPSLEGYNFIANQIICKMEKKC